MRDGFSVHLKDMHALKKIAPDIAAQFASGNPVVHKSSKEFSLIATDQVHEQNNRIVKGEGGLTENPQALRRRMVSGPELARLVNEFERAIKPEDNNHSSQRPHEEQKSFQVFFAKDVKELVCVFEVEN